MTGPSERNSPRDLLVTNLSVSWSSLLPTAPLILVTKREHRVSQPGAAFEMPSVFSNKLVMPRIARRS